MGLFTDSWQTGTEQMKLPHHLLWSLCPLISPANSNQQIPYQMCLMDSLRAEVMWFVICQILHICCEHYRFWFFKKKLMYFKCILLRISGTAFFIHRKRKKNMCQCELFTWTLECLSFQKVQNSCWGHQLGPLGRSAPSSSRMPPPSTTSAKNTMIHEHEELHSDTIYKLSTHHGSSWLLHFADLGLMSEKPTRCYHWVSTSFLWANVFHPHSTGHMFMGGILSWLIFVHLYKLPKQGNCFTIREGQALLSIHVLYISFSTDVCFSLFTFFPFLLACTLVWEGSLPPFQETKDNLPSAS